MGDLMLRSVQLKIDFIWHSVRNWTRQQAELERGEVEVDLVLRSLQAKVDLIVRNLPERQPKVVEAIQQSKVVEAIQQPKVVEAVQQRKIVPAVQSPLSSPHLDVVRQTYV